MALAGTREQGRLVGVAPGWRAERALIAAGLRSIYPYLLALTALIAVTIAYQASEPIAVRVGGGYDAPYVRGFHERAEDDAGRYRWATGRARVLLPGAGARPATLAVVAAARPDGVSQPVQVVVNGLALGEFAPAGQLRAHEFALPATYFSYGDLTVDLLSAPQVTRGTGGAPVEYGPRVAEVRIQGDQAAGGWVKPALRPLAAWALIAPLLYFLLLRLGLRAPAAAAASLVGLLAGAAATAVQRLDLALFAPRLAFLLALAYALLVLTDLVVPRLYARGGAPLGPRAWRILQLIFTLALVLKLGGISYPQLFVIDQPWHDQQFEKVLQGRFLELYRPDPAGISGVPGHWGVRAQIPYSPFLYLFGLPLYLGPLGRDLSINLWSGLLDLSRVYLVCYLARRLGASTRASLIAAFVIALTASTFLLHSWGNYPTTISQYGALLFLTLLVAGYRSLRRPWVFAGLLALLTLTMLLYTVTAVFIGLLLVFLLAGIAWRGGPEERRALPPLAALLTLASALAFLAYYAQFIGPLLNETLPAFRGELGAGRGLGLEREPFGLYLWRYVTQLFAEYGILTSLALAPVGAWALLRGPRSPLAGPLLGAWFGVFVVFVLVGARVDMVRKEAWFVLPAVAICAGVACDALLRRGKVARWPSPRLSRALVALYLAHLTWLGVVLWFGRILYVRH